MKCPYYNFKKNILVNQSYHIGVEFEFKMEKLLFIPKNCEFIILCT